MIIFGMNTNFDKDPVPHVVRTEVIDSRRAMAMWDMSNTFNRKSNMVEIEVHKRGESITLPDGRVLQANENQRVVEYWVDPKIKTQFEENVDWMLEQPKE